MGHKKFCPLPVLSQQAGVTPCCAPIRCSLSSGPAAPCLSSKLNRKSNLKPRTCSSPSHTTRLALELLLSKLP